MLSSSYASGARVARTAPSSWPVHFRNLSLVVKTGTESPNRGSLLSASSGFARVVFAPLLDDETFGGWRCGASCDCAVLRPGHQNEQPALRQAGDPTFC